VVPVLLLLLLGTRCSQAPREPAGPPLSATDQAEAARLVKLAEVEEARFNTEQRRRLVRLAGEQKCPCPGVRGTLAECAGDRKRCIRGPFAVRSIIRGILRDDRDDQITGRLLERFGPREPEVINLRGVPCKGPAAAPVVMVIFSDFQCPFCGMAVKLVEEVQRHTGDKLRICFKHFPLPQLHPNAELAARAAAAAQRQGKFWPMHDRLFAHRMQQEREDMIDHAAALGLDTQRFEADLDSVEVKNRVLADLADAIRLRLRGTPTFIINGREMTDPKSVPIFLDWIAEALAMKKAAGRSAGGKPDGESKPAESKPAKSKPAEGKPAEGQAG
jgi:predicted DsbA family dithiol-disulfide isomerase